jgi:integrase
MDILRVLADVRTSGDLVFFGHARGRTLSGTTLKRLLRRLGHDDITIHGMRSCFRDWCADTGKPPDVAEAAMAHVIGSAVARAYARSDLLEQRRGLMQQWADFLTRPAADVVPLRATG